MESQNTIAGSPDVRESSEIERLLSTISDTMYRLEQSINDISVKTSSVRISTPKDESCAVSDSMQSVLSPLGVTLFDLDNRLMKCNRVLQTLESEIQL